jgi:ATP-binding cassette subfamily B multidrug efflux pump
LTKLLPYMKKYKIYALLAPIFVILEVLGDIILPYLMSLIVDVGVKNRNTQYIIKTGIIMIIATMLSMLSGIISAHFSARFFPSVLGLPRQIIPGYLIYWNIQCSVVPENFH